MSSNGKPVVASVGAGMMGQLAHIGNYARLRDDGRCTIAGVTDLQGDLAEAVAERYRIPRVYASIDELLADPDVDGVTCIQQWPNNYPLVKQILSAGKSVITEKPMVGRLDEAEELVALAKANDVLYAVGFMKRYDLGVEIAKQMLRDERESGSLGALLMVDSVCNGGDWLQNIEAPIRAAAPANLPPLKPTYPDACKTREQRVAYDWLVNIFSHTVNLCHHLLGQEMSPKTAWFNRGKAFASTLACDGAMVTVRGAMSASHEWREWTTLTFEQGEIRIDTPVPMHRQQSATVTVTRKCGDHFTTTIHHAPAGWAFFREAEGFVQALAGEAPLRAPAESCLQDVRVMQRIIEIAEIG